MAAPPWLHEVLFVSSSSAAHIVQSRPALTTTRFFASFAHEILSLRPSAPFRVHGAGPSAEPRPPRPLPRSRPDKSEYYPVQSDAGRPRCAVLHRPSPKANLPCSVERRAFPVRGRYLQLEPDQLWRRDHQCFPLREPDAETRPHQPASISKSTWRGRDRLDPQRHGSANFHRRWRPVPSDQVQPRRQPRAAISRRRPFLM